MTYDPSADPMGTEMRLRDRDIASFAPPQTQMYAKLRAGRKAKVLDTSLSATCTGLKYPLN